MHTTLKLLLLDYYVTIFLFVSRRTSITYLEVIKDVHVQKLLHESEEENEKLVAEKSRQTCEDHEQEIELNLGHKSHDAPFFYRIKI